MPEKKKRTVVPRLRFPEFRNAGPWEVKRLGEVYRLIPTRSFSRECLTFDSGAVRNIHYGDIHTKYHALFDIEREGAPFILGLENEFDEDCYCVPGDIVCADASEDLADIGKAIEIVNVGAEKVVAGLHTLHARQLANDLIVGFGGYLFQANAIRDQIRKQSQGAKVLGISASRLKLVKLFLPGKLEQHKIAACLSSLDELIQLEAQKLDALKAHKKGLMQQLFPREGETTPRLRFAEFRDAGPWKYSKLEPYLEPYRERIAASICEYPVYTSSREGLKPQTEYFDGRELANESEYGVVPPGYFVYRHMSDDATFKFNLNETGGPIAVSKEYPVFKTSNLHTRFLLILLNEVGHFKHFAAVQRKGGTRTRLYFKTLCSFALPLPSPDEQQKIADCLSSLDELIQLEAQKLNALKAHKKGLMQQLFPQEVSA